VDLEESSQNAPDLSRDSTDELSDKIAILSAHIQAATCRLLLLIAEMDRREGWAEMGFILCAHWLHWKTNDSLDTAREKVRVARKLVHCPLVVEAFSQGRISYSKARAITRIVTPENEAQLLEYALDGSTSQLERIVRSYRKAAPAEEEQAQRQNEERFLSYHIDDDRMLVLKGRLPPEVGALLVKALQVASEEQCEDSDSEPNQRLCDALGEVAGAALDNLVLLCSAHHRAVHEGGYGLKKTKEGELIFRSPEGLKLEDMPLPVVLPPRPVEGLLQQNEELNLSIHGKTGQPTWDGMVPVDYDAAVEWLLEIDATS